MKKVVYLIIAFCVLALNNAFTQSDVTISNSSTFKYIVKKTSHQQIDSILVYGKPKQFKTPIVVAKSIYKHDKAKNTVKIIRYQIDKSYKLQPKRKIQYSFDVEGERTAKLFAVWDSTSQKFVQNKLTEYDYPTSESCFELGYSFVNNRWTPNDSTKSVTTYNANQDPLIVTTSKCKNGKWIDSLRTVNRYDKWYRILDKSVYAKKADDWKIITKYTYKYDNKTRNATIFKSVFEKSSVQDDNLILDKDGKQIETFEIISYSMVRGNSAPTISPIVDDASINNSFSPAKKSFNQGFHINTGKSNAAISIFNIKGDLLCNKAVRGDTFISMSEYGKGSYFIKLTIDNKTSIKRLTIK